MSEVAVVTGAAGWLGQNLVRALAADGRQVRCLVRAPADGPALEVVAPTIEVVAGDVRDPSAVDRLFDGIGDATVFHTASVIHPLRRTRELFDVNVGGTQLVLDRARRGGAGRFVHVSSNSPFGTNPTAGHRFTEDSPFDPYLAYGRSKWEAEQLVRRASARGDVPAVIIRPPWFYGPWQPPRQSRFFAAIRKGRFPLVGDGSQQRSMVYTGNLVHGLLRAEVVPAAIGNAYWVADPEPYELRAILDAVQEALRLEGLDVAERAPMRVPALVGAVAETADRVVQSRGRYVQAAHVLGELRHTIACDVSKAQADLGYDPPTTLLDGMRASIRWCLERGERL